MFVIWKRPGERAQFRFMPGCLLFSLAVSILLTIVANLLIRVL